MRRQAARFRPPCAGDCCARPCGALLSAHDAHVMAKWQHGGGFSVDANVRIEAHERDGLERLLRYCARPAFALVSAAAR